MTLTVRVVPRASRTRVCAEAAGLKVYLTRPAQDGEANSQLVEVLAEHYRVKKYSVRILRGHLSRTKIVEIDADAGIA